MSTTPRVEIFGPIHKAIRCALVDLLTQLGTTSFAEPGAAARVAAQLEDVTAFCEDHRALEDSVLLPALTARLSGSLDHIRDAHQCQAVVIAELRALATTLQTSAPDARVVLGRTLYLHFSTFTAELLLHMAEEEQVVQPLLEKLFSDDELSGIYGSMMARMTTPEKMRSLPWLLRGTNPVERAAIEARVALMQQQGAAS